MAEVVAENNRHNVRITGHEYGLIRSCAPNMNARIAVRLLGEAGLFIVELGDVRLSRIRPTKYPGDLYWLDIPEIEGGGERYRPRKAILTQSLVTEMQRHAFDQNVGGDDVLFDFTKRAMQAWVKQSAEEAAERFGIEELTHVSSSDLRNYWVRYCVETCRMNPRAVMEIGGFQGAETFMEQLTPPDDDIKAAEYSRYGAKEEQ